MKPAPRFAPSNRRYSPVLALCILIGMLMASTACRTVPRFASVDFTQNGWKIKSGQAVWQVKSEAPEIAGELIFATHPDGRIVVQMTKTPFPMVIAQFRQNLWQIEFPTENKRYSGQGKPPKRLAWLHLAKALNGEIPSKPWTFKQTDAANWRLENLQTGEVVEGFLQ